MNDSTTVSADSKAGSASGSEPWLKKVHNYRRFWWLALIVFSLDQVSKFWISAHLPFGTYGGPDTITVIPNFFYLVHVGNTGAAWSMFSGKSTLLALLAGATLISIFFWRKQLGLKQRLPQCSFGLLCGGIVGNLIDRMAHGHVIDFLDFHFGSYVYPTFNIADSGICIGVFLYLLWSFRQPS